MDYNKKIICFRVQNYNQFLLHNIWRSRSYHTEYKEVVKNLPSTTNKKIKILKAIIFFFFANVTWAVDYLVKNTKFYRVAVQACISKAYLSGHVQAASTISNGPTVSLLPLPPITPAKNTRQNILVSVLDSDPSRSPDLFQSNNLWNFLAEELADSRGENKPRNYPNLHLNNRGYSKLHKENN